MTKIYDGCDQIYFNRPQRRGKKTGQQLVVDRICPIALHAVNLAMQVLIVISNVIHTFARPIPFVHIVLYQGVFFSLVLP